MTATELKKRAIALAEKTKIDSVTPEEVGQLSNDIVEYIENVEINGSSLGIRKTYTSVSAMEADSTAPKDDKGVLLRRGMLVNIYNQEDPDSADNGKVFSFQNPGWAFRGTVDAGYATKEELTELSVELHGYKKSVEKSGDTTMSSTLSVDFKNIVPKKEKNYLIEVTGGSDNIKPRGLTIIINGVYYYEYVGNLQYITDYSAILAIEEDTTQVESFSVQIGIVNQLQIGTVTFRVTNYSNDTGLSGDIEKITKRVETLEKEKLIVENDKGNSTSNPISQNFVTKELYGLSEEETYYDGTIDITTEKTASTTIREENIPKSDNYEYRIEVIEGNEHITPRKLTIIVNGSYYIENPGTSNNNKLNFESDYSATFKLVDGNIPPTYIQVQIGTIYQVSAGTAKFRLSNVVSESSSGGIHGDIEKIQNRLSTTVLKVNEIESRVQKLEENSSSGGISTKNLPSIHICDLINCVVGDTIQLYYNMFVHHIGDYSLNIECLKGKNYPRYWEYTPTINDVGSTEMKIQLLNIDGSVIQEKIISIITKNSTNPLSAKNILLVGDSLYMSGEIPIELSRRLKGTKGVATSPSALALSNFNIVGRLKNSDGTVGWEGTGGWSWDTYTGRDGMAGVRLTVSDVTDVRVTQDTLYKIEGYTQKFYISEVNVSEGNGYIFCAFFGKGDIYNDHDLMPESGVLKKQNGEGQEEINFSASQVESYQPFWNTETDSFDIKVYVDTYCDGHLEILCVQLGINSIVGANPFTADFSKTVLTKAKAFIDLVHSQLPETKIYLATLPLPSQNGGIGANYAAGNANGSYLTASWNYKVHKVNDLYRSLLDDEDYKTFVSVIDVCSEMDSENNYPASDVAVNTRSATIEKRGTNGIHPFNDGYWQIADAWFRAIIPEVE